MTASPIRLIAGLGNPGPRYEDTRHNAGFWLVDEIACARNIPLKSEGRFHGDAGRLTLQGQDCWLLKPGTFMNRSGQAVGALARYYKIPLDEILVVHDELDLDPGVARLKKGGGHGGHNGLRDIMAVMGGKDFLRLRLGIGHPGNAREVVDYVLTKPSADHRTEVDRSIERVLGLLPQLLAGELAACMNSLHARR